MTAEKDGARGHFFLRQLGGGLGLFTTGEWLVISASNSSLSTLALCLSDFSCFFAASFI